MQVSTRGLRADGEEANVYLQVLQEILGDIFGGPHVGVKILLLITECYPTLRDLLGLGRRIQTFYVFAQPCNRVCH